MLDRGLQGISNMDVLREWEAEEYQASFSRGLEPIVGKQTVLQFQETPLMSTYLVAFVVGHLESIETTTPGFVSWRVSSMFI